MNNLLKEAAKLHIFRISSILLIIGLAACSGSKTEPDRSGSREGLRIGIIKGLFAWAGKCVGELSQGRPPLLESFGHSMTIGTCPENHAFMYLTSSTMRSRGNGRQDISFKCENQDHYLCRSNRE